ncbi:MAG: protein-L-isoaspartate O-methyltransferase [Ignavibacteria bacterium GWF2_33_9]|nr:MAG: protein-L-isoaspartate O-methyltransferase [Ignavibacteria bacterium GWF2_33_9]
MSNHNEILRDKLINSLIDKGIDDDKVLNAIKKVPREKFVPFQGYDKSYEDIALPIECNQTISQPFTVALMTSLLNVFDGAKVLEIGTGSGYQAAILSELKCDVYTVESIPTLYMNSQELLKKLDYQIHQKLSDGTLGWIEESPFDRIIVTSGAPEVPKSLLNQLQISGKMVIPVGDKIIQEMYLIIRESQDKYKTQRYGQFKFVPLIGAEGWAN